MNASHVEPLAFNRLRLFYYLVGGLHATLLGVSLFFFISHPSQNPWVFGWSDRYLFAVVCPLSLILLTQTLLLVSRSSRWPKVRLALAILCLLLGLIFAVVEVIFAPHYEVKVLSILVALNCLPLVGFSIHRRPQWLLTYAALLLLSLALLLPEALGILFEGRVAGPFRYPRWGDSKTFRFLFPIEEPFIGPGGRLRPNLSLEALAGHFPGVEFTLVTNSMGFRNSAEFSRDFSDPGIRILSLGDSFSTGYGIDQEVFFGALLESLLDQESPSTDVSVLNAEVSDPAYGLYYLQRFGLDFSPKVILYGLCSNDIAQTHLAFSGTRIFSLGSQGQVETLPTDVGLAQRGRMQLEEHLARFYYPAESPFIGDGRLPDRLGRLGISWLGGAFESLLELRATEPIRKRIQTYYRHGGQGKLSGSDGFEWSRTGRHLRLFDIAANWGLFYRRSLQPVEELYASFLPVLKSFARTARRHGALFALVYFPRREQVQPQDWESLRTFWNLNPDDFDLDLDNSRLARFCEQEGIPFCDLTARFRKEAPAGSLYLRNDLHFNERGHRAAAEEVAEFLNRVQALNYAEAGSPDRDF